MAEGVPTNNQRGRRSGRLRLLRGLDKARHIVPTALLVIVQCFRCFKSLYKAVQGCTRVQHKTYSRLDDQWVILSSSKAFNYFRTRRDEIRCVFDPP